MKREIKSRKLTDCKFLDRLPGTKRIVRGPYPGRAITLFTSAFTVLYSLWL
jgi:hypothetical protein